MNNKIRFIGSEFFKNAEIDKISIDKLQQIAEYDCVSGPCIALPDFHYKAKMEAPSSVAIATKDYIVPQLSSTSLNCGMGVIATPFYQKEFTRDKIVQFYRYFRDNKNNPIYKINKEELLKVMQFGPMALFTRFDVAEKTLDAFELQGNLFGDKKADISSIEKIIPEGVLQHKKYNGMDDLGTGLSGNHFLELQKVVEVYNDREAYKCNVSKNGQVLIMYHGGGGIIPGIIGAYFARRNKGYGDNWKINIKRLIYHIKRGGLLELPNIFKYHMKKRDFIPIYSESNSGERFGFANNASMNYGYAYRLLFYIRVRDSLSQVFGCSPEEIILVKDKSHNLIHKEKIQNNELFVHRHNSCRATEGEILLLPGFYDTNSYLCLGGEETEKSLNSVPHGAGDIINVFKKNGTSTKIDGPGTIVFNGYSNDIIKTQHYSGEGVELVVNSLEHEKILAPILKTTPLAVLKKFQ